MYRSSVYHSANRITSLFALSLATLVLSQPAAAKSWNNIEPLRSRRADVERALGKAINEQLGDEGTLHFKVAGGVVTVTFVTARFVANKKLSPSKEGTVLEIVLQHENSSDTPESMGLPSQHNFIRDNNKTGSVYRNLKEGVAYTFINGRLRTSRFAPSAEQFERARRGK